MPEIDDPGADAAHHTDTMTLPEEHPVTEGAHVAGAPAPGRASERVFHQLLANTLLTGLTGMFLWWAFVFWAYLETGSVVVTGVIGAGYAAVMAAASPAFGTYVDRHRTQDAMRLTTLVTLVAYGAAAALYVAADGDALLDLRSPGFWTLSAAILIGSVAAGLRGIAMSTAVTLLVPAERRDRANGMVGTITGVSFALTSVFSGLAIGLLNMGWAVGIAVALVAAGLVHLMSIRIEEPEPAPRTGEREPLVDLRGALDAIRAVPGLGTLVALSTFNNLLGGVFMALLDAYGLEMVSVETWGVLWAFLSLGFIVGGLVVSKVGLGPAPVKVLVGANLVNWALCIVFPARSSIVMLSVGIFIWITLSPAIEAAEQTVLQRSIPYERQGRVFGFAQLVEQAATPVSSVLIAPVAESWFMPLMDDGWGAEHLGGLIGTGPERGIALVFMLAGLVGLIVTLGVRFSSAYRRLSGLGPVPEPPTEATAALAVAAVAPAATEAEDDGGNDPPDPDALPAPALT